ncbi:MAG: hypothetical protein ACI90V_013458, partial [Bacillariaceae sp.]
MIEQQKNIVIKILQDQTLPCYQCILLETLIFERRFRLHFLYSKGNLQESMYCFPFSCRHQKAR